ncbi:hypothetical protein [Clostridium septicum]|uniref:hypothetical protein n=1 Tax=Clostridium septicum TaxID=1504 RepID=UPI00082EACEA|nr:hypothetical protein [Clostridium septicum]
MKKWLSKLIGSLNRKKKKTDKEDIPTVSMDFVKKEKSKSIVQVFKIKDKNLLKQRKLQLIANRTKTARIREKNIKRLVSLIEQEE